MPKDAKKRAVAKHPHKRHIHLPTKEAAHFRNSPVPKPEVTPDVTTKIIFYLAISDMAERAKRAWAALLPHMNDGQRERLASVLETSFLDQATRGIDEHLKQELERINAKYAHAAT